MLQIQGGCCVVNQRGRRWVRVREREMCPFHSPFLFFHHQPLFEPELDQPLLFQPELPLLQPEFPPQPPELPPHPPELPPQTLEPPPQTPVLPPHPPELPPHPPELPPHPPELPQPPPPPPPILMTLMTCGWEEDHPLFQPLLLLPPQGFEDPQPEEDRTTPAETQATRAEMTMSSFILLSPFAEFGCWFQILCCGCGFWFTSRSVALEWCGQWSAGRYLSQKVTQKLRGPDSVSD